MYETKSENVQQDAFIGISVLAYNPQDDDTRSS